MHHSLQRHARFAAKANQQVAIGALHWACVPHGLSCCPADSDQRDRTRARQTVTDDCWLGTNLCARARIRVKTELPIYPLNVSDIISTAVHCIQRIALG